MKFEMAFAEKTLGGHIPCFHLNGGIVEDTL